VLQEVRIVSKQWNDEASKLLNKSITVKMDIKNKEHLVFQMEEVTK
jgi:hypothetical protein